MLAERDSVGLGWLDCENCDQDQKEELGCHRFGLKLIGRKWTLIDFSGEPSHDKVRFCPRSCVDDDSAPPGRVSPGQITAGIEKFSKVKACGGLASFNGESPSDSPPRVSWFYATISGVADRYSAEVKDTQARLNAKVVASLNARKGGLGNGF